MSNFAESRSVEGEAIPVPFAASLSLIVVLVVFGGLGWWLSMRAPVPVDPRTIERFPIEFDGWRGMDVPIEESVEKMLRADAQVQRNYRNAAGELVWLYIGYYGTERGGRPEHTPWACYPSAGWTIESATQRPMEASDGTDSAATQNEFIVEQAGHRRLVRFWYATHRKAGVASEMALTLDHLIGHFSSSGRADGALVRVSTPLEGDGLEAARERLSRFSGPLVRRLRAHWPPEAAPTTG